MRIIDWSSDVCSSDLCAHDGLVLHGGRLAEFGNGDAALTRSRNDLVIDVVIVARIDDGGEVIAQQPVEHIEHDDGTSVADMRRVIDRRAADIHGDARGAFALGHDLFSMGLRVVETKRTGHALYPRNLARRTPWGLRG